MAVLYPLTQKQKEFLFDILNKKQIDLEVDKRRLCLKKNKAGKEELQQVETEIRLLRFIIKKVI